jgi:hypothetical protein
MPKLPRCCRATLLVDSPSSKLHSHLIAAFRFGRRSGRAQIPGSQYEAALAIDTSARTPLADVASYAAGNEESNAPFVGAQRRRQQFESDGDNGRARPKFASGADGTPATTRCAGDLEPTPSRRDFGADSFMILGVEF